MLRQVAHIHVYRQTVVIGDLRFAKNQRSKIVEQRLFDVVAGTVDRSYPRYTVRLKCARW